MRIGHVIYKVLIIGSLLSLASSPGWAAEGLFHVPRFRERLDLSVTSNYRIARWQRHIILRGQKTRDMIATEGRGGKSILGLPRFRETLELSMKSDDPIPGWDMLSIPYDLLPQEKDDLSFPDISERESYSRSHSTALSPVRVSLSFMDWDTSLPKAPLLEPTTEKDPLNSIRSLPSTLRNSSYRDSLDSMGRIVEPKIYLGIEF